MTGSSPEASPGPLFVVGAPRTGTTLMMQILNRHPRIYLYDEIHYFELIWDDRESIGDVDSPQVRPRVYERVREMLRHVGSHREIADALPDEELARHASAAGGGYRGLLTSILRAGADHHGADVAGDSSPQDVLYIDQILEWYPQARIIGLVRDPRGFLSSYKNYHRRGVATYRERYNPLTNSMLWRSYMRALQAGARKHPDSVAVIRYEDLVDDPPTHLKRLCAHIGVPFDGEMLNVSASNTSFGNEETEVRGIVASSRDRWRTELTPTEIWLGERIFGREMQALGYDPAGTGGPSPWELLKVGAQLPRRAFNLLFRTGKPLTWAKLRRVLGSFRSG
ncbi:MAG: sulfotransferase [Gemmatimonadetes bacterium]|nr:sulfotransferase [Gemmatimonadota bacterium]